jgi:tripartite-type tricarboxylate transporter receptor subunit TctC
MNLPARREPAKVKSSTKGYCMPSFYAKRRVFVLAALVLAGLARPAAAQTYPTQNITFQVGFAAGGIADVVARFVGQKLTERMGQTVVVENRGGAGGNLAAKSVIGAAPDGYTILATTTGLAVNETGCARIDAYG